MNTTIRTDRTCSIAGLARGHIFRHLSSPFARRLASVIRLETVTCYSVLVINKAPHISLLPSDLPAPPTFQELADQQGVAPVNDFDALLGKPVSQDESAEEFAVRLRQWRREGPVF
jgi:hypothetical protein